MMKISSLAAATALASFLLMGGAFAQATAPAKTEAPKADTKAPAEKKEAKPAEEPKKKGGFGLGKMMPAGGGEQKQANVTASGGARGVDPEKDSKGGSNPALVAVKIAPAEVTAFKKEGGLS